MQLLQRLKVRSSCECGIHCNVNDDCLGYNFNSKWNECELVDGNQLIKTNKNQDWRFIAKCLQGKDACIQCLS